VNEVLLMRNDGVSSPWKAWYGAISERSDGSKQRMKNVVLQYWWKKWWYRTAH